MEMDNWTIYANICGHFVIFIFGLELNMVLQFLLDPSPIIALSCQKASHWPYWDLTDVALACEDSRNLITVSMQPFIANIELSCWICQSYYMDLIDTWISLSCYLDLS